MTGRELIIYILENNLEEQLVYENGKILGLLDTYDVAAKLGVGPATVNAHIDMGNLQNIKLGGRTYCSAKEFEEYVNHKGGNVYL